MLSTELITENGHRKEHKMEQNGATLLVGIC